MASPFTFTPGVAGEAYIDMHYAEEIIENFTAEGSEKYVYKILGLRGSGKSVIYSKVLAALRQEKNWLVYSLSSGGDPLQALIGMLSKEAFITNLYSPEAALKEMISVATEKGYHVLIGIDDIAKTKETTAFLSMIGDMVLDDSKKVYLICTGLSKNIEDFISEPHLSFFVRGDKIEIKKLSIPQIAFKYQSFLSADRPAAKALAEFTCGYAYAYQLLGELCYRHKTTDAAIVTDEFDSIIADQYDLIWSSLTPAEQELTKIIVTTETGSVEDIKSKMKNKNSFPVLRSRLIKKHILTAVSNGAVSIELPRIKEYINTWLA